VEDRTSGTKIEKAMHLLIPAAGTGRRMGSDRNKLLLPLLGKPLIAWTLEAVAASGALRWIGVIIQKQDKADMDAVLAELSLPIPVQLIPGGPTRQDSVYNGLKVLPPTAQRVLIHDGARCLVTSDLIDRCTKTLMECRGIIAAVPVKDTIKVVDREGIVESTPEREQLWAAQTPQGFDVRLLKNCHAKAKRLEWSVTDDATLFEKNRLPVKIVEGEETNLKVTTPMDLAIAEYILSQRQ
jgi:2-C-methyl-D-erythritol 4-phosphate cytidylyltransferase